jgi:riboflavin kinase / FMN adenylyltransferase
MPDRTDDRPAPLAPHSLDAVPAELTGGAVAIGNFDGVHRGHAALLGRTRADARRLSTKAVALTFDPHPRTYFNPAEPVFRLTPPAAKARLLSAIGVDGLVVARFDPEFAGLTPDAFVSEVLVGRMKARAVTVGDDFRFAHRRAGTTAFLGEAGARFGFEVDVVGPVLDGAGGRISSSEVRDALAAGDVAAANTLLGYRWFVTGRVAHGARRGRDLGFPTANIVLPDDNRLRHGIYAVTLTRADGTGLPGVASFGRRPQFDDGAPLLEVYAFDFSGDLYDERVIVTFHAWIRPEQIFPTVDDLVRRMGEDVAEAKQALAGAGRGSALDRALRALA